MSEGDTAAGSVGRGMGAIRGKAVSYLGVGVVMVLSLVTNRAPMDGSGSQTPWIRWLPWGRPRRVRR